MDPFESFKAAQRRVWATFTSFETITMLPAARLVRFAGIAAGARVLDAACGTGVVAVTAARAGARVVGLDLTPDLLVRARENAAIAGVEIEWREGDVEALPFPDGAFDVVMSQFGHMFAPRPEVATAELLRVLRPGGTIAFSTWPPELFTGRMMALVGGALPPPPPPAAAPPPAWGDPAVVRERLGAAVEALTFDRGTMLFPALSPQHHRTVMEQAGGLVTTLVEMLSVEPARLAAFRREYDALAATYFEGNCVRQDYLMARATKR